MLSVEDALSRMLGTVPSVCAVSTVPTLQAGGRILAQTLVAPANAPPIDNSAMDGYAVLSADVPDPGTTLPVSQRIAAGTVGVPLSRGTAARIFTGAPIPAGADAVVMQEWCVQVGENVTFNHRPKAGEHIRKAGSDIALGAEMLPAGVCLRAQDIALAASVGTAALPVRRRLRVALLCTGDELRMPGEALPAGTVYNTNYFLLTTLLEGHGCEVLYQGQVPDDLGATCAVLQRAAQDADLIVSSGGVSVGEEDHVRAAVAAAGRIDVWKIAIKPGKPLAFGAIAREGRDVPFIGLPGNPVSCLVTFVVLVRPLLLQMQGAAQTMPAGYPLRADFEWLCPDARREFLRARRCADGRVSIFGNQTSGVLTSAVWGDGLIDNPPQQVIRCGDTVRFVPFSELLTS